MSEESLAPTESPLMDSLTPENPPPLPLDTKAPKRLVFGFWGTTLWGVFAFGALSVGQIMVLVYEVLRSAR